MLKRTLLLLLLSTASAQAQDWGTTLKAMIGAGRECPDISLDYGKVRARARESLEDSSEIENCINNRCEAPMVSVLQTFGPEDRARICEGWKQTIGKAGLLKK